MKIPVTGIVAPFGKLVPVYNAHDTTVYQFDQHSANGRSWALYSDTRCQDSTHSFGVTPHATVAFRSYLLSMLSQGAG